MQESYHCVPWLGPIMVLREKWFRKLSQWIAMQRLNLMQGTGTRTSFRVRSNLCLLHTELSKNCHASKWNRQQKSHKAKKDSHGRTGEKHNPPLPSSRPEPAHGIEQFCGCSRLNISINPMVIGLSLTLAVVTIFPCVLATTRVLPDDDGVGSSRSISMRACYPWFLLS